MAVHIAVFTNEHEIEEQNSFLLGRELLGNLPKANKNVSAAYMTFQYTVLSLVAEDNIL